ANDIAAKTAAKSKYLKIMPCYSSDQYRYFPRTLLYKNCTKSRRLQDTEARTVRSVPKYLRVFMRYYRLFTLIQNEKYTSIGVEDRLVVSTPGKASPQKK